MPLDGSRSGARALPFATEVARRFGAELILVRIVRMALLTVPSDQSAIISPSAASLIVESAKRHQAAIVTRARLYLQSKLRRINEAGVRGMYFVLSGSPGDRIIEFCRCHEIDMVVMSTTGKGGLRRVLLGSVADQIIRESGLPVLVIGPQHSKEDSS